MDTFLNRQFSQIQFAITNFRNGVIDLNALVQLLEAIGNVIGGAFWEDGLFPLILDLESINSELLDKKRMINSDEQEHVNRILNELEEISNPS